MNHLGVALGAAALLCACSDASPFGGPHGGDGRKVGPTMGWVAGSTYAPPPPPPPPAGGEPGTWNHIFSAYFEVGTEGNCPECHVEMKTAASSYQWLRELEYIGTVPVPLVDYGSSTLAWFGGNMPPSVLDPVQAEIVVSELNTWAANGAKLD